LSYPTDQRPILSPPLKWAGGKRWLVPLLQTIWDPDCRLVEPFVGGMAVALGLQPQRAVLNDWNPHLVNFYQWLQQGLTIGIPMQNDSDYYYQCRSTFNQLIASQAHTSQPAAELFYYLNRTGYNGLCRFNSRNQYNVPFGRYKTIHYTRDFGRYLSQVSRWDLSCGDFAQLRLRTDDFIYADPPYDVPFTRYSARDFDWADQQRLAHWLSHHQGQVIVSNQATERILDLYRTLDFGILVVPAPRRIACTGDRSPALEMLAYKGIPEESITRLKTAVAAAQLRPPAKSKRSVAQIET